MELEHDLGANAPRKDPGGLRAWLGGLEGNFGDQAFRLLTAFFAGLAVLLLAAMAFQMARASVPSIKAFGWRFLVNTDWDPVLDSYGALPYIFGTLVSSLVALAIVLPVALGVAIYLAELAPLWVRRPMGILVELLAAIPSVIYGLWGIFVMSPWLRDHVQPLLQKLFGWTPFFKGTPRGFGMMAGCLVLAIMILPTIASVSRDVLLAVPGTIREGALALGATRWEMVRKAVLPCARSGILGAVILGLGRALGETMAVTMVIGNRPDISWSLFSPAHSLASVVASNYAEASGDLYLSTLTELGLILFGVTLFLNILARLLIWRVGRGPAGARS
ncbi:MAG TPA: phosphate ABC transporter permease subunit PstC [Holophaga sp.]|nr:phosphate ABC transporter permease subunit PstC [Holophaga sp.]